ncbi:hypothetical protein [Capnocytophaga leadbetteri]
MPKVIIDSTFGKVFYTSLPIQKDLLLLLQLICHSNKIISSNITKTYTFTHTYDNAGNKKEERIYIDGNLSIINKTEIRK